jgi:hypothetical protein
MKRFALEALRCPAMEPLSQFQKLKDGILMIWWKASSVAVESTGKTKDWCRMMERSMFLCSSLFGELCFSSLIVLHVDIIFKFSKPLCY